MSGGRRLPPGVPPGRPGADAGAGTPRPLSPCELFSEDLHLLADRELGPAETARIEEHLLACPHCAGLAAHLERMSSILKAWDAEVGAVEPPALRMRHAVLARVQEQGVIRRRDDRTLRFIRFATAALVLLGLGLGVVLGLQAAPETIRAPLSARLDGPMPLAARQADDPGFASGDPVEPFAAVDILAGLDVPALPTLEALGEGGVAYGPTPARWHEAFPQTSSTGGARVRATDGLPLLVQRIRRHDALATRLGERVTSWNGPRGSVRSDGPLITVDALSWLHERGYLARWVRAATPVSPTRETERATAAAAADTRMTARAMLRPMPGIDRDLRLLRARPPIIRTLTTASRARPLGGGSVGTGTKARKSGKRPTPRDVVHLLDGWALPRPAPSSSEAPDASTLESGTPALAARVRFLDPIAASANGQLSFAESGRGADSVVVFVEHTRLPIFIPAGQFLTGGLADRVLAQPVWLPASRGKKPYMVTCRVVQKFELGDLRTPLVLQREIAGPTLRALLAGGASSREVRQGAERILAAVRGQTGTLLGDWSLYAVHRGMHARVMAALGETKFRWSDLQGFVVTDGRGRFVGSEVVRPGGPAATELLRRLWVSYSLEAGLRHEALLAGGASSAFASPQVGPGPLLRRLAKHTGTFRLPLGVEQFPGARVSSLEIVAAGVALHAVEVARHPMFVSTLDLPAR